MHQMFHKYHLRYLDFEGWVEHDVMAFQCFMTPSGETEGWSTTSCSPADREGQRNTEILVDEVKEFSNKHLELHPRILPSFIVGHTLSQTLGQLWLLGHLKRNPHCHRTWCKTQRDQNHCKQEANLPVRNPYLVPPPQSGAVPILCGSLAGSTSSHPLWRQKTRCTLSLFSGSWGVTSQQDLTKPMLLTGTQNFRGQYSSRSSRNVFVIDPQCHQCQMSSREAKGHIAPISIPACFPSLAFQVSSFQCIPFLLAIAKGGLSYLQPRTPPHAPFFCP